jgi:hypothetical protein
MEWRCLCDRQVPRPASAGGESYLRQTEAHYKVKCPTGAAPLGVNPQPVQAVEANGPLQRIANRAVEASLRSKTKKMNTNHGRRLDTPPSCQ